MGCKRRVIQYAKMAGKILGGVVVRRIANTVDILESAPPDWITNHDKRRLVSEDAKAAWAKANQLDVLEVGTEIEGMIRSALETALWNLRQGVEAIELGDDSDADENLDV